MMGGFSLANVAMLAVRGGGPAKKSDTRYADVYYARIIIDTRCCLFERPPCYYQSLHE